MHLDGYLNCMLEKETGKIYENYGTISRVGYGTGGRGDTGRGGVAL